MAGDPHSARFASTRWSLVQRAGGGGQEARAALSELCGAYWYPLYALARRRGASAEDAADLVQGFFADLLGRDVIDRADPGRGRFRAFLCSAFLNFGAKERERSSAQKRGGGRTHVSLDIEAGEARYRLEPVEGITPELLFERRFAHVLLDRALERLARSERSGPPERAERFEAIRTYLGDGDGPPYRVMADRLGVSETSVKVAVHRLRARFREALRAEVIDTVGAAADVDAEIRHLIEVLSGQ